MTTLEHLRIREAELLSRVQVLESSLADVRVHMAEMQGVNRNAITYNLPVEMLSTIFEIGQSESPPLQSQPIRYLYFGSEWSPLHTPFEIVVSSVSRRWRNVALQTPRLWTRVYINVIRSTHDLLGLYLRRSKMCLLDITLSWRKLLGEHEYNLKGYDPKVIIQCKRYLQLLMPHVGRWREFRIRRDDCLLQLSEVLAGLANLNAPALETLMLEGCTVSSGKLFSSGAPRLTSVELIGVPFYPPLEDVKHLKFYSTIGSQLSYAHFRNSIQPMRSVVHLHLDSSLVQSHESPAGHPPIRLPSVICLEVNIHKSQVGCGVLPVLDLPSIETLTIHGDVDVAIEAFTLSPRLYPKLQFLNVVGSSEYVKAESPSVIALAFISLFPNVRDISFHCADPTPIFHTLCDRWSMDEVLWPRLSSVTIIHTLWTRSSSVTSLLGPMERVSYIQQVWADIIKLVGNRAQLGHPISFIKLPLQMLTQVTQRQRQRLREQVTLIGC